LEAVQNLDIGANLLVRLYINNLVVFLFEKGHTNNANAKEI
jgi:hypothetical protein